jgi:hypothetical protein
LISGSETIIFESTLTTFEASSIFEAAEAVAKLASAYNQTTINKFSLPKSVKHTVVK